MSLMQRLKVWPTLFRQQKPRLKHQCSISQLQILSRNRTPTEFLPQLIDTFQKNRFPAFANFTLNYLEKNQLECDSLVLDQLAKCLTLDGKQSMERWIDYYGKHRVKDSMDYINNLARYLEKLDVAMYFALPFRKTKLFSQFIIPNRPLYTLQYQGCTYGTLNENTLMNLIRALQAEERVNDIVQVMEICYSLNQDKAMAFAVESLSQISDVAEKITTIPTELFKEFPRFLSKCIRILVSGNQIDFVLELLGKLKCTHGPSVYLTMIQYYTNKETGSIKHAMYWYTLYKKQGYTPSKVTIGHLIHFLKQQSKYSSVLFDQVEKVFLDYDFYDVEVDTVTCGTMIDFYCLHAREDRIFGLLHRMKRENIPINLYICHILMRYFIKVEQYDKVPGLLEIVEKAEPNMAGLLSRVDAKQLDEVQDTKLIDPKGLGYIIVEMIKYIYQTNQVHHLEYYINVFQKFSIPVTGHFYAAWIVNLRKRDETREIFQILDHASNQNVKLPEGGISHAIGVVNHVPTTTLGNILTCIAVQQNPEMNYLILTSSMFAYIRSKDYLSALAIYKQLSRIQKQLCDSNTDTRVDPFLKTSFVVPLTGLIELCLIQCQNQNKDIREFWVSYLQSEMEYWIGRGCTLDRNCLFVLQGFAVASGAYPLYLKILHFAMQGFAKHPNPLPTALTDMVYHLERTVRGLQKRNSTGKLRSLLYTLHRCTKIRLLPAKIRFALHNCHFRINNAISRIQTRRGL